MTPEQEEVVASYRSKIVAMFRAGQGGFDYPHHLKHGEQWYRPEEWDDQGNYYGPPKPMMPVPVNRTVESPDVNKVEDSTSVENSTPKKDRKAYMKEYYKKKKQTETGT